MPTYDYTCTSCGHRFEAVQSFSDPALTSCPVCQGAVRKVYGNVGIVLKGSGFYKTDNRRSSASNGSKPKAETTSGDSSNGSGNGGGSAEPAATPASSGSGSEKSGSND
jgi:putative FmdB family regulatory protein